jgi:cytochrome c553
MGVKRAVVALAIGVLCAASSAQTPAPALLNLCSACHGKDGRSSLPNTPSLAAQPRTFLENQLIMMREGLRPVPAMQGMLDKVTDDEVVALAKHFATMPLKAEAAAPSTESTERGKKLSADALCNTCHLRSQHGRDQIPRLAGQREDYLVYSMKAFRDGNAPGRDTQMQNVMRGFSDAQIADLAKYFSALP